MESNHNGTILSYDQPDMKTFKPSKFACLIITALMMFSYGNTSAQSDSCVATFGKTYGGEGDDEAFDVLTIALDHTILAGRSTSGSAGDYDGLVARLSDEGVLLWSKTIGGAAFDELRKVKIDNDGNLVCVGTSKTTIGDKKNAWIIKLTSSGVVIWSKLFHPGGNKDVTGKDLVVLADGGYAFTSVLNDEQADSDGWIVKLDKDGFVVWDKLLDNGKAEGLYGIAEISSSIYVGGYCSSANKDALMLKLNSADGALQWSKTFEHGTDIHEEILELQNRKGKLSAVVYMTLSGKWAVDFADLSLLFIDETGSIISHTNSFRYNDQARLSTLDVELNENDEIMYAGSTGFDGVYSSFAMKWLDKSVMHWWLALQGNSSLRINSVSIPKFGGNTVAGRKYTFPKNDFSDGSIYVLKTDRDGRPGFCNPYYRNWRNAPAPSTSDIRSIKLFTPALTNNTVINQNATFQNINSPIAERVECSTLDCRQAEKTWEQCNDSYHTVYSSDNDLQINTVTPLDDGNTLAFGVNIFRSYNRAVAKIAANGKMQSLSSRGDDSTSVIIFFSGKLNDGTVFTAGIVNIGIEENSGGKNDVEVRRYQADGTLIQTRIYSFDFVDWLTGFHVGSDGFIYIAAGSKVAHNFNQYGTYLFKFAPDLSLVWSKRIDLPFNAPIYRAVTYSEGRVYLAGVYLESQTYESFNVAAFDASTGEIHYQKRIHTPRNSMIPTNIFLQQNEMFVTGLMHSIGAPGFEDYDPKATVLRFDKLANIISGFQFDKWRVNQSYSYIQSELQNMFTRTQDGKIVVAYQFKEVSSPNKGILLCKFDLDGNIDWSRKFTELSTYQILNFTNNGNHLYITGLNQGRPKYNVMLPKEPFMMKLLPNGLISENGTGACKADTIELTKIPVFVEEDPFQEIATVKNEPPIALKQNHEAERKQYFYTSEICASSSVCTSLILEADETVCSLTDTLVVKYRKGIKCNAPLLWKFDKEAATLLNITDSTAFFLFRKTGSFTIEANLLPGCSIITEKINVSVSDDGSRLELGNDLEICAGQSVTINAGDNFKTYLWQDNQSMTSKFTTNQAGIYAVSVVDFCGRAQTDTIKVSYAPAVILNLGSDTAVCENEIVQLKAPSGMIRYDWGGEQTFIRLNDSTIRVKINSNTKFWASVERSAGCTASDTIMFSSNPSPVVNLGADILKCAGDLVTLDAGNIGTVYSWSNGSGSQTIYPTTQGTYFVKVTDLNQCSSSDTVVVQFRNPPHVNLGKDTMICEGTALTLTAGGPVNSYVWQSGSTQTTFSATAVGKYWVTAKDIHGCSSSDTIAITRINKNPGNFLPGKVEICIGRETEIRPASNFISYFWSTGSSQSSVLVKNTGNYILQVKDVNGCIGKDTVIVKGQQCLVGVFMPSAFTPNNDGKNDLLKPAVYGSVKNYRLLIFNRWGQKVFESADPSVGWDGRLGPTLHQNESFAFTLTYQLQGSEKQEVLKGTVMLIR